MFTLKNVAISGANVLPIIEGGKGINVSTGLTAGSFAKAGCVGTLSGTSPDYYDEKGNYVPYFYDTKWTRKEKFAYLIKYSIMGGVAQSKIAHDVSQGQGRIHINMLWEAGGTKVILDEVLAKTKGLLHGITCGAGLPYALSDLAEKYNLYYYPIISSSRAFRILWKRSYNKVAKLLGGVVYEDPWLAGGHNGLSNQEDPDMRQDPYLRIVEIRKALNEFKLSHIPIIIAGGVWNLKEWAKYINNSEVGEVAFQFGTRPLLTKESPISMALKKLLTKLKEGDINLNKFSPTGFYSSALNNPFLKELTERTKRQVVAHRKPTENANIPIPSGNNVTNFYVQKSDYETAMGYIKAGYDRLVRTPSDTVIFETQEKAESIKEDQINCMGCLNACRFSGWAADNESNSTGILPDPRSFCIQKSLLDIGHGDNIDNNLIFLGHNAYRFASDNLYKDGFIPTIAELVERIKQGD